MNASISTQKIVAAVQSQDEVRIIRFMPAPKGFVIDALQGAFMVVGSGVSGGDDVRVAQYRCAHISRSGRTITPRLLERGWIPGFRADQLPKPGDGLLDGRGEFVVFPVGSHGDSDHMAFVVQMTDYYQAWNAWYGWRRDVSPKDPTDYLLGKGVPLDVIRLARNATRAWPGSDPKGTKWSVREAMDLVEYHGAWLVEEEGDGRTLVYCPDRAVVVNCPSGFEFPDGDCTAYGLCNIGPVQENGQMLTALFLQPDEEHGWAETLWIKVWRGDDWALFRVEELMLRTGSPIPDANSWPKWVEAVRTGHEGPAPTLSLVPLDEEEVF